MKQQKYLREREQELEEDSLWKFINVQYVENLEFQITTMKTLSAPSVKATLVYIESLIIYQRQNLGDIWKPISAVAFLAAAAMGIFLLAQKPKSQIDMAMVSQLKDSISVLNKQIDSYEGNFIKESIGFPYVVRRGDSYCLISRRFYGVDSRAVEIAKNNNRSLDTSLNIGDTLYIK